MAAAVLNLNPVIPTTIRSVATPPKPAPPPAVSLETMPPTGLISIFEVYSATGG